MTVRTIAADSVCSPAAQTGEVAANKGFWIRLPIDHVRPAAQRMNASQTAYPVSTDAEPARKTSS